MHPDPSWDIAAHYGTTMPARATEPAAFAAATAGWKKRKLDAVYHEHPALPDETTFSPSPVQHNLYSPLHVDYRTEDEMMKSNPAFLATDAMMHPRPRIQPSLTKKRRLLHQQQQQPQQPQYIQQPQPRLYALNTNLKTPSRLYSPEISPKTIPSSMDQHQYPTQVAAASVLRPCHICHRRPTTREVLDAYATCELCGERACYICLRECSAVDCRGAGSTPSIAVPSLYGPDAMIDDTDDVPPASSWRQTDWRYPQAADVGKRRKVCSWCAVEGLTDGGMEVVHCLDCVRRVT
ncbi:hypothetical protein DTO212C5_1844 [Paecilomyces variotii]|nr:hypothetical protein DTO212C5_1844 [Paecilomyces variotii]